MSILPPTDNYRERYPSTVSLILIPAAYSSPIASIADFHLPTLHLAVYASIVFRSLLLHIQSTSYIG